MICPRAEGRAGRGGVRLPAGPVAQWQSSRLLSGRLEVRYLSGPPMSVHERKKRLKNIHASGVLGVKEMMK